jgi:hypothetical protein
MTENKLSAIAVSHENKERLAKYGRVPMSFNDILTEILDEKETRDKKAVVVAEEAAIPAK